jgi:hypothetical protein
MPMPRRIARWARLLQWMRRVTGCSLKTLRIRHTYLMRAIREMAKRTTKGFKLKRISSGIRCRICVLERRPCGCRSQK